MELFILQDKSNNYNLDAVITSSLDSTEIQKIIDDYETACINDDLDIDRRGLEEAFMEVDPYTHIIWLDGMKTEKFVIW